MFDAARLMAEHPPRWRHPNKRLVYELACPAGSSAAGSIEYSRWDAMDLPEEMAEPAPGGSFHARPDFFCYEPPAPDACEWYLNFADPDLFCAYGGPLFAQDELQVAEHPALASLREALLASGERPATLDDAGEPTPVLVAGVERRCRIDLRPDPAQGRPRGLYGNLFSQADAQAIRSATKPLQPPTRTHILAISAPTGHGRYKARELAFVLKTAFSGFAAARLEAARSSPPARKVVVHTGFWGCGAFGGNRTLMALLQVAAARLAGLDGLVFHAGDAAGVRTAERSRDLFDRLTKGKAVSLKGFQAELEAQGFEWGVSDGN